MRIPILFCLLLVGCTTAPKPVAQPLQPNTVTPAPVKSATPSPEKAIAYYTTANSIGAVSLQALDEAISYAAGGDMAALNALIKSGRAFYIKAGMKVDIECADGLCSKIKVRPVGKTATFFTVKSSVEAR